MRNKRLKKALTIEMNDLLMEKVEFKKTNPEMKKNKGTPRKNNSLRNSFNPEFEKRSLFSR